MKSFGHVVGQHLEILCLMLLGTLSLTWFRGHLINQGDFVLPLNRTDYFHATMNVWDPRLSFGVLSPTQVAGAPLAALGAASEILGLPLVWFEGLMFYIWFTASGLFMYYLCRTFGLRRQNSLFAGAFYMLNPFSLVIIWQVSQGQLQIPYMTAPLALAVYADYIQGGSFRKAIMMILTWICIGGTSSFVNPSYVALFSIPIAFLFFAKVSIFCLRKDLRQNIRDIVARSGKMSALFASCNLFWIVPSLATIGFQYSSLLASQSAFNSLFYNYDLNSANFLDSFRLLGYWALDGTAIYGPYYQWGSEYFSFPLIAVSFLVPALLGLPLVGRISQAKVFFATLVLVALILINGTRPPFGLVNAYLFENFFPLRAFQATFQRFGVILALSMSPLVAEGLYELYHLLRGNVVAKTRWVRVRATFSRVISIAVVFLLLVILVQPFWSGEVVQSPNTSSVSPRIEIPTAYYLLRDFTDSVDPDARIISLPLSNSYNVALNWPSGVYTGSDPTLWFSSVPVVMLNQNDFTQLLRTTQTSVDDWDTFARLLALSGVNYLVYHADTNFTISSGSKEKGDLDSRALELTLSHFPLFARYGELHLYENLYDVYPLIYAPQKFFVGNISPQSISDLLQLMPPQVNIGTITCNYEAEHCRDVPASYVQLAEGNDFVQSMYVPREGDYSLFYPEYSPLTELDSGALWTKETRARDSFVIYTDMPSPPKQVFDWTVDRSVGDIRSISFRARSDMAANLTRFYVWVKGDLSGNTLTVQIYDEAQNYLAFPQTVDWAGWRRITLQLSSPGYSVGQGHFDRMNIHSISYYYDNRHVSGTNSTVSIGPPQSVEWRSSGVSHYAQGTYTFSTQFDSLILLTEDSASPVVSYREIGTNQYLVNVLDSAGQFPLIFNESFDPGWKVCFGTVGKIQSMLAQCVPEENHFPANTYGNSWIIDRAGSFQLTILYAPDGVYHVSLGVSLLTWVLVTLAVMVPVSLRHRLKRYLRRGYSISARAVFEAPSATSP